MSGDIDFAGRVGFTGVTGDGVYITNRFDKFGGLVNTNLQGMYTEQTVRGLKFSATNLTPGVDHGATFTTTPPLALWNPTGSGKGLAVIRIGMYYCTGTLGSGLVGVGIQTAQPSAPTTGTVITPICMNNVDAPGVGKAYTGSTITAAATLIRGLFNVAPVLASSAVSMPAATECVLDGSLVVPPGAVLAVQGYVGAMTGTTPKVMFYIEWDEVPLKG